MLNQCSFIGNLGADPEIRHTQDGRPIANLSLGVSERWRDKNTGERKEKTTWVPVVIFNEGLAKIAEQYLKKGSKVFVQGSFTVRKWQDQNGNDRYATEIVMSGYGGILTMLDSKKDGTGAGDYQNQGGFDDSSEIPF